MDSLLMPQTGSASPPRSVSLLMSQSPGQLVVSAGGRRAVLQQETDYTCEEAGLRLTRPARSGLDLGEVLVHEVDVSHTFFKAEDGGLAAFETVKEHATIAGVPLAGPERRGATLRWPPLPRPTR
ncbi:hypothetical protein [Piscinibacter koreensis]|uniref:Uncharacterized protein n=1 Tax=Piscinibacter koreensis TaxID=2742824 RepID=A0A7Y6NSF0_9BURK|nr:hypothetical protein [Schlegelella koreensis]NUZ08474.1 hypothetical protein [Schlegelella koreensis]